MRYEKGAQYDERSYSEKTKKNEATAQTYCSYFAFCLPMQSFSCVHFFPASEASAQNKQKPNKFIEK